MKYLIFSDTHRSLLGVREVLKRCAGVDGVIFLGDNFDDSELIAQQYPEMSVFAVAGNCDFSAKYLAPAYQEMILDIDGVRVLLVHGHRHEVKWGLGVLEKYARSRGVDAVLFGHTHERCDKYIDGLYMFNPGSASQPRDGVASFGVMTVQGGQLLLSHGNVWDK